ncbi:hypothetical protein KUF71_014473 [Frankliniella fusca]|uniref:Integrase catalytic domain-containing protein n=1 Tax=Frankliniella fusca TaxID=407009 RepID=A0AAE1LPJ9_9NEOP|nr:hypothetical protein KUF71_014473 [Frankliniella fusca]
MKILAPEVTYNQARELAIQDDAIRQHMRKLAQQQTQANAVSVKKGHQVQQKTQYSRGSPSGRRPDSRGTFQSRGTARGSPRGHWVPRGTPSPRGAPVSRGTPSPRGSPATRGGRAGQHPSTQSNGECYRCGRQHNPDTCPSKQWQCYKCNRICGGKSLKKPLYGLTMEDQEAQHVQRVLIVSTIGVLEKFDPNVETFEQWFNHFEEYCNLNHVESEPMNALNQYMPETNRRRSLFLTHLKKFDDPGLVETNRINFKHRVQQQNESVFDFINALQSLAQRCGWDNSPNMSNDIEVFVNNCNSCAIVNFKETNLFTPWPSAKFPFERVHVDFFELQSVKYFLYCDSYSKWLDIVRMLSTKARDVITVLLSIFAMVGLPQKLVADNGPPFDSEEFVTFLTFKDIVLLHSPPYHPQSNGFAGKSVSTAKKALKKMILDVIPVSGELSQNREMLLDQYVSSFLLTYRNTPTTTTCKTPNQMIMSYQPRTKLSILNPSNSVPVKSIPFKDGDKVVVKLKKKSPSFEAVIVKYLGGTRYLVSASGVIREAHFNQLSHAGPL